MGEVCCLTLGCAGIYSITGCLCGAYYCLIGPSSVISCCRFYNVRVFVFVVKVDLFLTWLLNGSHCQKTLVEASLYDINHSEVTGGFGGVLVCVFFLFWMVCLFFGWVVSNSLTLIKAAHIARLSLIIINYGALLSVMQCNIVSIVRHSDLKLCNLPHLESLTQFILPLIFFLRFVNIIVMLWFLFFILPFESW